MSWSSSSCPSRSVSPVAPTIATPCPVPGRVHPSTASNARPSAVAGRRLGPGLHLLEVRQHGGGEEARALRVPVSVGLGPRLRVVAQRVGDVEPVSYTHLRAHE